MLATKAVSSHTLRRNAGLCYQRSSKCYEPIPSPVDENPIPFEYPPPRKRDPDNSDLAARTAVYCLLWISYRRLSNFRCIVYRIIRNDFLSSTPSYPHAGTFQAIRTGRAFRYIHGNAVSESYRFDFLFIGTDSILSCRTQNVVRYPSFIGIVSCRNRSFTPLTYRYGIVPESILVRYPSFIGSFPYRTRLLSDMHHPYRVEIDFCPVSIIYRYRIVPKSINVRYPSFIGIASYRNRISFGTHYLSVLYRVNLDRFSSDIIIHRYRIVSKSIFVRYPLLCWYRIASNPIIVLSVPRRKSLPGEAAPGASEAAERAARANSTDVNASTILALAVQRGNPAARQLLAPACGRGPPCRQKGQQ